jgi:Flp pilus assembly protein CpaB
MATIAQQRPASAPSNARNPQFRTPLFVAGVGLALFAFLAMFTFGLIFATKAGSNQQVTVVVAATSINQKDVITPEMVKTLRMTATSALPGTYSNVATVIGEYATVDIPQGQAITANLVSKIPSVIQTPPLVFSKGYQLIGITASEQTGVAGYVGPGDYIDIYVTMDKAAFAEINPGAKGSVTVRVFKAVYVDKVGPDTTATRSGQPGGVTSSLTVLMSPCDVAFMTWFAVNGQVKYGLVSHDDYPQSLPTTLPGPCTWADTYGGTVGPRAVNSRFNFLAG